VSQGIGMSKTATIVLILIIAATSLTMAKSAFAESVATLPVPEFTVSYFDNSYVEGPSTTIDPYNGTSLTIVAHWVENKTIRLAISPIIIAHSGDLHYRVREKGHFEQDWHYVGGISISDQSTQPHPLGVWFSSSGGDWYQFSSDHFYAPPGGQIDFQVKAELWEYALGGGFYGGWADTKIGESNWSKTQTITIPETITPSPNPSTTPMTSSSPEITIEPSPTSQPFQIGNLELIIIVSLIAALAVVSGLLVYSIKRRGVKRE
jgi:hypothetical protein